MKRILVATDGSTGAERDIGYAAQMAKCESAELLIVNVVGGYGLPDQVFRAFTNTQQNRLEELLESLSAELLTKARDRVLHVGAPRPSSNHAAAT